MLEEKKVETNVRFKAGDKSDVTNTQRKFRAWPEIYDKVSWCFINATEQIRHSYVDALSTDKDKTDRLLYAINWTFPMTKVNYEKYIRPWLPKIRLNYRNSQPEIVLNDNWGSTSFAEYISKDFVEHPDDSESKYFYWLLDKLCKLPEWERFRQITCALTYEEYHYLKDRFMIWILKRLLESAPVKQVNLNALKTIVLNLRMLESIGN